MLTLSEVDATGNRTFEGIEQLIGCGSYVDTFQTDKDVCYSLLEKLHCPNTKSKANKSQARFLLDETCSSNKNTVFQVENKTNEKQKVSVFHDLGCPVSQASRPRPGRFQRLNQVGDLRCLSYSCSLDLLAVRRA